MINGQPSLIFKPGRGIRQGDPFSPYLFILRANIFSGLIKRGVEEKKIHGVKVSRGAPEISHLLFADDSPLFSRANTTEARNIMEILQKYQSASRQLVNFDKSEASFSSNVKQEERETIQRMMGITTIQRHTKYLGISIIFGRSKEEIFKLVVGRVRKKVKG